MKWSSIDIFDINIVYEMQFDAPPKPEKPVSKRVLDKISKLTKLKKNSTIKDVKKNNILFFGLAENNKWAFQPVFDNLPSKDYVFVNGDKDYPLVKSLYLSIPYLFSLLKKFTLATSEQRKLIKTYPLAYLFAYGKAIIAYRLLQDYSPKLLVMANDHSPMNRCLLIAAEKLGIKTMYLQHASVTNKFPPLKFNYALLDGLESFEKYGKQSIKNSKVLLTGATRYDYFYNTFNISNVKDCIGISVNQFDDFDVVKELCSRLLADFDYDIIVRPHPDMIDWNKDWFLENGIQYSDASQTPSNEFLKLLRIQISNVSGIHLDSVILGVPTVQYRLSEKYINDQYAYIDNKLIKSVNNYTELTRVIKNPHLLISDDEILRYYIASAKTKLEGKVGSFVSQYILSIFEESEKEKQMEEEYDITTYIF